MFIHAAYNCSQIAEFANICCIYPDRSALPAAGTLKVRCFSAPHRSDILSLVLSHEHGDIVIHGPDTRDPEFIDEHLRNIGREEAGESRSGGVLKSQI